MALIQCSNCGGSISDRAKECPHCGYDFSKELMQKENAKEFSKIPENEQKALREEYNLQNYNLSLAENKVTKRKKTLTIFSVLDSLLFIIIGILLAICMSAEIDDDKLLVLLCILTCMLILGLIIFYFLRFKLKKLDRTRLIELKKFQIWLKESKQMTYNLIFTTEKEREIFNSFTGGE